MARHLQLLWLQFFRHKPMVPRKFTFSAMQIYNSPSKKSLVSNVWTWLPHFSLFFCSSFATVLIWRACAGVEDMHFQVACFALSLKLSRHSVHFQFHTLSNQSQPCQRPPHQGPRGPHQPLFLKGKQWKNHCIWLSFLTPFYKIEPYNVPLPPYFYHSGIHEEKPFPLKDLTLERLLEHESTAIPSPVWQFNLPVAFFAMVHCTNLTDCTYPPGRASPRL